MSKLLKAFNNRNKKQNKVEITKELKEPLSVYDSLEAIANGGYEEAKKEDLAYFLKCFGLFDKGEDFMLRVRVPGGQLTAVQALCIAEVAKEYGNDYIDITTRMQIELRFIKIANIAKVINALRDVGISTFQTGVDNPRNIVTDPLDGLAVDSIIDTMPIINKMQELFLEKQEWISALPRKFNTVILGSLNNSCNIYGHDCNFVLAQKDGEFGFNVYLGARVGVQAVDADVFVTAQEAPLFFESILKVFKRFGYRDNRNKNRLVFLLKDVGIESFIEAVRLEADINFKSRGVNMVQSNPMLANSNRVLQKNGSFAYKFIVPSGIFSGSDLIEASKLAQEVGSGDIRLTYDQNLYIVNVKDIQALESSELYDKYSQYNSLYFQDMIACAGTATCSFGVIANKPDAIEMANYLTKSVPIENSKVRMNWSACPKGCGVHGIGDIGFEGCKAKDEDGNRVDGVHLFVGGKITKEAKEAKVLHKSLPIPEAREHVKFLLELYRDHKLANESYEEFDDRFLSQKYTLTAVSFYTKINYILQKLNLGEFKLNKELKTYKNEKYEIFYFGLELYKLLTGEKRFEAVVDLEPFKIKPKAIKEDMVTKLNPKVPLNLSKAIYLMTHSVKDKRAQVFTEIFTILK